MGSIGQYPGVKDFISNAWIENVTLLNGQNGARLKAWAGPNVGYGYMDNITYKDIIIENTDAPVVLDQCYFNINETTCAAYPSNVNITNVNFINISGSSSGKNGKVVADLTCSPGATCGGFTSRTSTSVVLQARHRKLYATTSRAILVWSVFRRARRMISFQRLCGKIDSGYQMHY